MAPPHLFVWFWCVLDGAQRLALVLQLVVELAELGGGVASLLVDSFRAFVARLLSRVQTLTLSSEETSVGKRDHYKGLSAPLLSLSVPVSPPLFLQCCTAIGCAARLA